MFAFRPIEISSDWDKLVAFHRDTFCLSYGSDEKFSEPAYREIMRDRLETFPQGQMMVLDGAAVAGQVELAIRECQGRRFGYVSLFYLAPAWRGQGLGWELTDFAETCFAAHGLDEYRLRVAAMNEQAVRFYERQGFEQVGCERGERHVWIMRKGLPRSR